MTDFAHGKIRRAGSMKNLCLLCCSCHGMMRGSDLRRDKQRLALEAILEGGA